MAARNNYIFHNKLKRMGTCTSQQNPEGSTQYKRKNFKFVELVGQGGFGKVWKVLEKRSGKTYALKVMKKEVILAKRSEEAVVREKQLLEKLSLNKNQFIPETHTTFQDKDSVYILMDLIEGPSLRTVMDSQSQLTSKQISAVMRRVTEAVNFIHSNGVIHHDVKPSNLIVDRKGQPRLVDFGTACLHSKDNSDFNGGTLGYMAPQVAEDRQHSYTADYYALGIMTYELFFEKKPYPYVSKDKILQTIMTKPLNPENFPELKSIPAEASLFIQQLAQRRPCLRLGNSGTSAILNHKFLQYSLSQEEESQLFSILQDHSGTGSIKESTIKVASQIKAKMDRPHIQAKFKKFDTPTKTNALPRLPTQSSLSEIVY